MAELQGIEFQVKGDASGAATSLEKLAGSLGKIKSATANGLGISALAKDVRGLKDAVSNVNTEEIKSFSKALAKLDKVKISEGFTNSLTKCSEALQKFDANKLTSISEAIAGLQKTGKANVSAGSLGTLGNALVTIQGHVEEIAEVSHHLTTIANLDFSNIQTAAQGIRDIAGSAAQVATKTTESAAPIEEPAQPSVSETSRRMKELNDALASQRSLWSDLAGGARLYAQNGVIAVEDIEHRLESFDPFKYAATTALLPITKSLAYVEDQFNQSNLTAKDFFSSFASSERIADESATSFVYALDSMRLGLVGLLNGAVDAIKAIGGGFLGALKRAASAIGSVAKAAGKLALKGFANTFKYAIGPMKNFVGSIKSVASSFKRILGYRLIRAIIKEIGEAFNEGVQHVYQWSKVMAETGGGDLGRFAANMDAASTSLAYFKNSVGAAVAPLANSLAPAIRVVTDAAVQLLNVINQLLARLTGQTSWTKAIRQATEYGDAVSGAGGAAKEALKYLAPFDELNVLPDDKNRGGGGGSSEDYGGMFEEMTEFEEAIGDFAESIRGKIESAKWDDLGKLLGEKVNSILNDIDFAGLGAKVGEYINAWFTTKYWTLKTINFQEIGKSIAELLTGEDGIGGALNAIDFSNIGGSIAQKITYIPEIVIGAINALDFKTVGESFGDLFRGFFDDLSATIDGIAWDETVQNLVQGLLDTIEGFDITGALNSVAGLFSSIANGISGVDWDSALDDLVSGLWAAITQIDFEKLAGSILELLGSVVGAVVDWLGTLLLDVVEVLISPDTWTLVGAWLADLPAKLKNVGIKAINSFVAPMTEGLNKWIEEYNNSWFAEILGQIDPIEFKLIPEIPEDELNKNYDAAKQAIEGRSKKSPTSIIAQIKDIADNIAPGDKEIGDFTAIISKGTQKLPQAQKTIDVFANYSRARLSLSENQRTIKTVSNYSWARLGLSEKQRTVSTWAQYNASKNNLTEKQRTIGTWANYSAVKNSLSVDQKTIATTANFSSRQNGLSKDQRTFDAKARFNDWAESSGGLVDSSGESPWSYATAWFSKWGKSAGFETPSIDSSAFFTDYDIDTNLKKGDTMKVKTTAVITGQEGNISGVSNNLNKATGGVFSGGRWHDIAQYAGGGSPGFGQIFVAREAGPELVGTLGGHTAVMNNDQIVASVSAGVARAIASIRFQMVGFTPVSYEPSDEIDMDALYSTMVRAMNDADAGDVNVDVTVDWDGEKAYKSLVRRNRQNTRMTGVNAFA